MLFDFKSNNCFYPQMFYTDEANLLELVPIVIAIALWGHELMIQDITNTKNYILTKIM